MPTMTLNGVQIAYEVCGTGAPLILIGGYTMVKEAWGLQVEGLSSHFRILTFDNRGVGESSIPEGPFTIADMASDVIGLMDGLSIKRANVFGISMGGLIAQVLALDYPERVMKVALGCTTPGGKGAIAPKPHVLEALSKAADPSVDPATAVKMRVPMLFGREFLENEPERLDSWVQMAVRYAPTPQGAAGQLRALSRFNVRDRLPQIRCPVLVLTGSEDLVMDPENSRILAREIPGASLYVVQGAGHLFFLERPDEVNRVLIEFFLK